MSKPGETANDTRIRPPLREFVYLDDVSLRSLLASQKGELTDQVTDLLSQADDAELASTIGASSPILKAEVRARYQTTNSQGTQTSRKAVVQSLFKELRELDWIDVALHPQTDPSGGGSVGDLIASEMAVRADDLRRGVLVEIDVELVADPIFRFSTIASELTELAQDFPELLDQLGAREGMATLVPGNRFLQRFLVGLVPIRARATSHVVADVDGNEHVVPAAAARALGLTSRPLSVVGVTEQASYWRDVRTVLFSRSRFTMLCRVAEDGLRSSWEPVKLADVLKEVLPTFPDLIADVGRAGLSLSHATGPVTPAPIVAALEALINSVEASGAPGLTAEGVTAARQIPYGPAMQLPDTLTGQNEAFRLVIAQLREHGCTWTGDEWLQLERNARNTVGLDLFHSPHRSASPLDETDGKDGPDERLLDTEVIAIYW
ncbi:MAG: DUF6414 family protein [Acidimicrobiales bacterium]